MEFFIIATIGVNVFITCYPLEKHKMLNLIVSHLVIQTLTSDIEYGFFLVRHISVCPKLRQIFISNWSEKKAKQERSLDNHGQKWAIQKMTRSPYSLITVDIGLDLIWPWTDHIWIENKTSLEIEFTTQNLGRLITLTIGHDNSGFFPKWVSLQTRFSDWLKSFFRKLTMF